MIPLKYWPVDRRLGQIGRNTSFKVENRNMTHDTDEANFTECADAFIQLANKMAADVPRSRVSASFLYAASRYSAFNALAHGSPQPQEKEEYIEYLVGQFRAMLTENFDDQALRGGR
ncbi:MAG: DUF3144 domain-containing protein [Acidobacteriota bacterium]